MEPGNYGLPSERFHLITKDKISLVGWQIRHPKPSGILLLLHGFGTCKEDLLDLAHGLYNNGDYHLLLLDLRGHGASGGNTLSFGCREVDDIKEVLQFIKQNSSFEKLPVGCLGISMGGSIAILAAAYLPNQIRAVVSDSAYFNLANAIARVFKISYHLPRMPLAQIVIWMTALRLGCPMKNLSPVEVIHKISPNPIFLIHGMSDKTTPYHDAEILFQAAQRPKELWLVPDAEHVASYYKYRDEYLHRILTFYQNAFQRTT